MGEGSPRCLGSVLLDGAKYVRAIPHLDVVCDSTDLEITKMWGLKRLW